MKGQVRLVEGGGGEATSRLIKEIFWSRFQHRELQRGNDAAIIELASGRLAFSTDGFVVTPWKFPGGDIGRLAICGTVNDLTMMGAEPAYLTVSFIIEEGFALASLAEIAQSMAEAAEEADIAIVAGDTKVVNRGAADGVFISTAGVGTVMAGLNLGGEMARPGDVLIVTGSIGDHGATILMAREELGISSNLQSDVAPLNKLLLPVVAKYPDAVRVLRDPTRGGLAATINEIARQSGVSINLSEANIPYKQEVIGLTELLGLDPLYLANEGKAVLVVAAEVADPVIGLLKQHPLGADAAVIGRVMAENPGLVSVSNENYGTRILPLGSGEQLPRIC